MFDPSPRLLTIYLRLTSVESEAPKDWYHIRDPFPPLCFSAQV